MKITAKMDTHPRDHIRFTPEAVAGMIGQTPRLTGPGGDWSQPGPRVEIEDASIDDAGNVVLTMTLPDKFSGAATALLGMMKATDVPDVSVGFQSADAGPDTDFPRMINQATVHEVCQPTAPPEKP